jgi:putative nucleotidyltransferase with HDIG domain
MSDRLAAPNATATATQDSHAAVPSVLPDSPLSLIKRPVARGGTSPHVPLRAPRRAHPEPVKARPAYEGIRLTDVIGALSHALDMSEGQPVGHSVRTAIIGMRLCIELQLSEADRSALFYALLLKDLGSSSNAAQVSNRFGGDDRALKAARRLIDWTNPADAARYACRQALRGRHRLARGWHYLTHLERRGQANREMATIRSDRGAAIARQLAMPKRTCEAIAAVEEHWDGRGMPHGLRGPQIPVLARIVSLAQTVEVFDRAFDVATAFDVAHARRGRWFDPVLVDALDTFRDDAGFWKTLRCADALPALRDWEPPTRIVFADELRLDTIAEAFARVIDAKSPYTARHSQNVSFLATRTATELDMTSREVRAIRRAGLLHDIGKLGVGNSILDKPGPLTPAEMTEVRQHTRYTLEILKGVKRFERFATLAASHHERLDGSGYHLGLAGHELSLSARVLAAADVCEAMSANRPYRAAMPISEVLRTLRDLAAAGRLCPVAVEALVGWFRELPPGSGPATHGEESTSLIGI